MKSIEDIQFEFEVGNLEAMDLFELQSTGYDDGMNGDYSDGRFTHYLKWVNGPGKEIVRLKVECDLGEEDDRLFLLYAEAHYRGLKAREE